MYPALAVHQALDYRIDASLWVGSQNGLEQDILASYQIDFVGIPGGGVHGMRLSQLPRNVIELLRGYKHARSIVREFKPDVIFYTGGYIGVPMALAARNIPSVVFIPDVEPGLALNVIIRTADMIAMSTDQTEKFIKKSQNAHVSGYPIRKELKKWSRQSAREFFGIGTEEKVLLVFGGSKGARSINDALFSQLVPLTKEMHVIHITGKSNWDSASEKVASIKLSNPENYHAYPFLDHEMGAAFAAADLVVCRAGASTIGELPYFGLPAILVPYPHAWRYQHQNAEHLVSHGGAILLKDEDLPHNLSTQITDLMCDQSKLSKMRDDMRALAVENAAELMAEMIFEAGSRQMRGSGK